jgi:hypothetical protein
MISKWTDDEIQELRRLWTRGDTARQIAHTLRRSRSAVLGMKWRLGLEEREGGGAAAIRAVRAKQTPEERAAVAARRAIREQRRARREQADDQSQRQRIQAAATRKTKPPIRVIAREGRLVEPLNLPFVDLDDNQKPTMCRFPTVEREGKQMFCARPAEHGTSYCDDCCRVVYTAEAYARQINKAPALRRPVIGHVLIAAPFSNRDYNVVGLVREVPFA